MAAPREITPAQLQRRIGLPDCPVLIDVCLDTDFDLDPWLIPGARRCHHLEIDRMLSDIAGRSCVIICQKGRKLSQGVAAVLHTHGIAAEYLQGGMMAWRALKDAPVLSAAARDEMGAGALWVTRHRPKIDRIACPWLIRRFICDQARFLFVAPGEVLDVAARFQAVSFDADGASFSHGPGTCTFDTLLAETGLQSPALLRMADVIRAADLGDPARVPEAAGLLAVSVGLSRQYRDDNAQLEAALPVYDALYRWARDGHTETHASQLEGA